MSRHTMMFALGVGALVLAGCNDRSDMRADAGEARSQAEDGRMSQESLPADQGRPTGTLAPIQGSGMQAGAGNENATLAMSGSPSSHLRSEERRVGEETGGQRPPQTRNTH